MNLSRVIPRLVQRSEFTREDKTSSNLMKSILCPLFSNHCLIGNIVRANKLYIYLSCFLPGLSKGATKKTLRKRTTRFFVALELSVLISTTTMKGYLSFINVNYIFKVLGVAKRKMRRSARRFSAWLLRSLKICLAWTKSKDQIASSEGLNGVNRCGRKMGQTLSPLCVNVENALKNVSYLISV